jgi:hypothetical protein
VREDKLRRPIDSCILATPEIELDMQLPVTLQTLWREVSTNRIVSHVAMGR